MARRFTVSISTRLSSALPVTWKQRRWRSPIEPAPMISTLCEGEPTAPPSQPVVEGEAERGEATLNFLHGVLDHDDVRPVTEEAGPQVQELPRLLRRARGHPPVFVRLPSRVGKGPNRLLNESLAEL